MEALAATTGEQAAVSIMEKRLYSGGALTIKQEAPESILAEHVFLPSASSSGNMAVTSMNTMLPIPQSQYHKAVTAAFQPSTGAGGTFGSSGICNQAKRMVRAVQNSSRKCQVCEEPASGNFFGALVCLPCKTFFIRCTTEDITTFKCRRSNDCEITGPNRSRCKYCRYQKCVDVGMIRKERPEYVEAVEGQQLCVVCRDIANGIHFGVISCEGCKKFFRRGLQESDTYVCKYMQNCIINPKTRNDCRFCRFKKCLRAGMSRDAIKMGRPRKNMKELTHFEQNSSSLFNSMSKCQDQQLLLPSGKHHNMYHPYPNSRMMSIFYQMQHKQQQSPPSHLHPQSAYSQPQSHQPTSYNKTTYPLPHLESVHKVHNNILPSSSSSHFYPSASPQHQQRMSWLDHPVNTPGSLSSEHSESSGNESGTEEHHYPNSPTSPHSPINFSFKNKHPNQDDLHPLSTLEFKYGNQSPSSSSQCYQKATAHSLPRYNIKKEVNEDSCYYMEEDNESQHVGATSIQTLSPPPTPPANSMEPSAALDLSQESHVSLCCEPQPESPSSLSDTASQDQRSLEATSTSSSPAAEQDAEEDSGSFPSKHKQIMQHEFKPEYWSCSEEKNQASPVLNDNHRTMLDTMVTAYQSLVEEFCKDNELRDLKPLWHSKDVSQQTIVFQKQVIHQLATVISFVHVIPGFNKVHSEDKYTILRLGTIQMASVVAAINLYNPLTNSFVKTFFEERLTEESPLFEFRNCLLKLARCIHQLNLDSVEAACLLAVLAVASDWPALQDAERLEEIRKELLEAFKAYVTDKYGSDSSRLSRIFGVMPQLRELCMWHYKITFELSFME